MIIAMLNKAKVLKELQLHVDKLFLDVSPEYRIACTAWQRLVEDPDLLQKISACSSDLTIPVWQGRPDATWPVAARTTIYSITGIDGSQIYPDKHQGTSCALVNIGLVSIIYGSPVQNPVLFSSEPSIMIDDENTSWIEHSTDSINCQRQKLELEAAYQWYHQHAERITEYEHLVAYDGSLIFWHLDSKDQTTKTAYLTCYLTLMQQMYDANILMAGYVSMPKSKDLVNIVRAQLCNFQPTRESSKLLEHLVDTNIANLFLTTNTRSTVFQSTQPITRCYPEHLRPYFFYLHTGGEIARVEIPAWIARDQELLDRISRLLLDQAHRGNGYPVVLAEAHEQAVVKGPDRDFFYHLIQKLGIEKQRRITISPKSLKKRGIGI